MMLMLLVRDQTLRASGLGRAEGRRLVFIMESITLTLGILFPLAVHSEPQSSVLFSKEAETSQQVTSFITLLSLNFPREC
jgi:hypothetical protein